MVGNSRTFGRKTRGKQRLARALVASAVVHLVALATVLTIRPAVPPYSEYPEGMEVFIHTPPHEPVTPPLPEPAPAGEANDNPTPPQAARTEDAAKAPEVRKPSTAPSTRVHRTPPPPANVETVVVAQGPVVPQLPLMGDGELAGALVAGPGAGGGAGEGGSGGGGQGGSGAGGSCDMAGRLQAMIRRDAGVRTTIAQAQAALGAGRRAMRVWDGDWVRSGAQEGRGLAGLRQAIAVEVAFAPRECRMERIRGFVVLSLDDGPEAARIALGASDWRWGELATR